MLCVLHYSIELNVYKWTLQINFNNFSRRRIKKLAARETSGSFHAHKNRSLTHWNKYIWLIRLTGQFNENNLTDSSDGAIHFKSYMHLLPIISRQSVLGACARPAFTVIYTGTEHSNLVRIDVKQIKVETLMNRLDI